MTSPLGWNSVQMDHSRGNTPERLLYIGAGPSRLDSVNLDTFQRIVEKMSAAESLTLTSPPVEFRVKKHPFVRRFRPRHRRSPHVPVDGPNRCGRRSPYDRNLCLLD